MKKIEVRTLLALSSSLLASACFGLAQVRSTEVKIASFDGFELVGNYSAAIDPGPGVLLLHQCNRGEENTGLENLAAALAERGFHVLSYDSRGFGKSRSREYKAYHEKMEEIDQIVARDVAAAYQHLSGKPGVDANRIGVVGASCGSWKGINLASRHSQVRTLIFLSGTYLGLKQTEADYQSLLGPIFAIFSQDDRYGTPASMRDAFARSLHPDSRLLTYKGDLHGSPLLKHDLGLVGRIVDWMVGFLIDD